MARSRRSKIPVEDKVRVVLSVLAGETSAAEAARRRGVSTVSVGKWKQALTERVPSAAFNDCDQRKSLDKRRFRLAQ